ncbi:MAG: efflux RND transporter permease subunit, partial [Gammaproteobacteria bacterium]
ALEGAREVAAPVTAATATTVAAFLPMFAVGGTMGAFIAVIPVVVGGALLGSLLEAFGVLPSHAAAWLRVGPGEGKRGRPLLPWGRLREAYAAWLERAVARRYLVALAALGLFALSVQAALTHLPFRLFGHVETGQFFIHAEAPVTYSLEDSARLAARLEREVLAALAPRGELRSVLANVGVSFVSVSQVRFGSHLVQLVVDLAPERPRGFVERWIAPLMRLRLGAEGTRTRSTEAIMEELRRRLAAVPGVRHLSVMRPRGGPAGPDVEVGITGPAVGELARLGEEVAGYLRRLPGVRDVRHDLEGGKLELRYRLNERGRELGLTQADLARALRAGFQGLEALQATWRDAAGRERRLPVRVLYPEAVRHGALDLEALPVVLPGGGTALLGQVAELRWERGYQEIHRRDGRRMVTVTAEVAPGTSALAVTEALRRAFAPRLAARPGYRMLFLGERRETARSMADLLRALVVALALIFFILVALFQSLLDPLVVMVAIPFGFVGVVAGHALMGVPLEFLSLIGFLALAGIVVNDSLILVEFAKRRRAAGAPREAAVVEAAAVRARPILLTSVTTFLGVSPLIFFATGQAAFLRPMAVSLGFGLLGATLLILVALPCFYLVADDLRRRVLGLLGRGGG